MFKNKIKVLVISIVLMCVSVGKVWAQQMSCEESNRQMRTQIQEHTGLTGDALNQAVCESQEYMMSDIERKMKTVKDAEWIAHYKQILECYQNTCEQKIVQQQEDESVFNVIDGIITGYSGKGGNIIIPNSIDGQEITSIGVRAFENKGILSVVIPDGVTEIGDYAFANNGITTLTLPNSISMIRDGAFHQNKLYKVTIPQSVRTIRNEAFVNNSITHITIGENVDVSPKGFNCGDMYNCFPWQYKSQKSKAGTYIYHSQTLKKYNWQLEK